MAKFNVTVNIDYLDGEGNLDDSICEHIVDSIVANVSEKVTRNVEQKATDAFNNRLSDLEKSVSNKLNEMMEEFFSTPKDITDKWGDIVEKGVTVKEKLKKACDDFMYQAVDKDGNPAKSSYDTKYKTRVDYFVAKSVDHNMQWAIERAVNEVTDNLKKKISDEIKKQIGDKLANVVGLDDMIN